MDTPWKLSLKLKNHFMEFHGGQVRAYLQGETSYPWARVTLASGLKLGYPITQVNFTSFADMFRHAWHFL